MSVAVWVLGSALSHWLTRTHSGSETGCRPGVLAGAIARIDVGVGGCSRTKHL